MRWQAQACSVNRKSACTQAACYPPRLCAAVVKGIQVIKKKREMIKEASQKTREGPASVHGAGPNGCSLYPCTEAVLYELELEDMCEKDPSTWEDLATQRW